MRNKYYHIIIKKIRYILSFRPLGKTQYFRFRGDFCSSDNEILTKVFRN